MGGSAAGSAIIGLFAREPRSRSLFHPVDSNEMWHFYGGDPVRLVLLHPDGGEWALFACTVTPEFIDAAFRGGHADELLATHPDRRADIERLSLPAGQPRGLPGAVHERAQDS